MIKSALIIVPHPDDEINMAGGLFETLHKSGVHTTVVICTNGDYILKNTTKRYYEAKKAQKILKYQELFFLGYGDGWEGTHIYDVADDKAILSHCGRKETYCAGNSSEYCFLKSGRHNLYTRANYKNDIRSVIIDKKADLIICVDLDRHVDHRCVSLLFDECMGEILKNDSSYRPYILKGFAYDGVFFGPDDFFDETIKQTAIDLLQGEDIRKRTFPYNWNDRIQIKNNDDVLTFKFWKNPIFRALLAHKTQSDYYVVGFCALACFPRIANPDACYWYRSPFNLALSSNIETSSGDARYLNDFLIAKPNRSISDDLADDSKGWTPELGDITPEIIITFPRLVKLSKIVIYQNANSFIDRVMLKSDIGYVNEYQCTDSNVVNIDIPSISLNKIYLQIISSEVNSLSINEIECYEEGFDFPWEDIPLVRYKYEQKLRNKYVAFCAKYSYRIIIKLLFLYSRLKAKSSL
jgi:LmbE family N-acetylglucosaminyl deacetylase